MPFQTGSPKNNGKTFSITLYGQCAIQEQNSELEKLYVCNMIRAELLFFFFFRYRKLHLERNPDYKQFIQVQMNFLTKVSFNVLRSSRFNDFNSYCRVIST